MAKRKSAFASSFAGSEDVLKEASKAERLGFLEQDEIIQALGLTPGVRKSIVCKLSSVTAAQHAEGSSCEGLPYVNFVFSPVDGPLQGSLISNFMAMYDYQTKTIDKARSEWVYRELQALDYETAGWGPDEIETAAIELSENTPLVSLVINCTKLKKGKRVGQLAINLGIGRLIGGSDSPNDDDDDTTPSAPPVEEAPAPRTTRGRGKKATDEWVMAIGDKVSYTFTEEGLNEVVEATITAINKDKQTVNLHDGEYDYDNVSLTEITKL